MKRRLIALGVVAVWVLLIAAICNGPVAIYSADPVDGPSPLTVEFDGSASYDLDGWIDAYEWIFGDGGSDAGVKTTHTYTATTTRSFTATLTVTDNDGKTGSTTGTVTVEVDGPPPHCCAGMPIGPADILLLQNIGYVVGYSDALKNPLWACYRLSEVVSPIAHDPPSYCPIDNRTTARVSHDDYTNSGYDRGHMAPNKSIDYCYGQEAQRETYLMSNICPQTKTLNRGIWRVLEDLVRGWANAMQEVWVFTGPVFDYDRQALSSGVDIPDEFYKIIVDELNGSPRVISFLIPQDVAAGSQLETFLVSVDEVERVTGLDFLWELNDAIETTLEAQSPIELWDG